MYQFGDIIPRDQFHYLTIHAQQNISEELIRKKVSTCFAKTLLVVVFVV